jgi:hypothetical protein
MVAAQKFSLEFSLIAIINELPKNIFFFCKSVVLSSAPNIIATIRRS